MSENRGPSWEETLKAFSARRQMEVRSSHNNAMVSYPDGPPPPVVEQLRNEPTSTYTEFFRGNTIDSLTIIARQIVPEIQSRERRAVRIGMVACSGGEEAYTLAALIHDKGHNATITGMDINPVELENARKARYKTFGALALSRAINLGVVDLFAYERDYTQPADVLRGSVDFKQHDILQDPLDAENPFDIITMYNLLYHYSETSRETIINNTLQGLRPGGSFAYEGAITVNLDDDYPAWGERMGRKLGLPPAVAAFSKIGIRTYDPTRRDTPEPPMSAPGPKNIWEHKPPLTSNIETATIAARIIPGNINQYY